MGIRFIKVAVVYLLIGVIAGMVMGIAEAFEYTSAHAHINLLGWASLGLIGVLYVLFPKAGETSLAKAQFWMHNIGLPLLVISMMFFANNKNSIGIPLSAVGGLLVIFSVILLVVNVFKHVKVIPQK